MKQLFHIEIYKVISANTEKFISVWLFGEINLQTTDFPL